MQMFPSIEKQPVISSRVGEIDFNNLEFGRQVSDHMFVCDFSNGKWHRPSIVPFQQLRISPTALALHYGQTVFEGMKAFYRNDGDVTVFRIEKHYERFARSLDRMCMAVPSRELFEKGLLELISVDRKWVPVEGGASLYIRPFVYASEARFGVKISDEFRFIIFTGPVPELYQRPIRVKVETNYVRAAKGGTGFAKCGGNYGGSYYPTRSAREEGYDQVLWTDARENKFIEESGMMNVMFVIDGALVTPPLSDSILDGVTRDSLLTIAKHLNIPVYERPVPVEELKEKLASHKLTEAFGVGTAAVVAPVGTIGIEGVNYELPEYTGNSIHQQLKERLNRIRTGEITDTWNWNTVI